MASRKLNTAHLAEQLEMILNSDGLSPERLASLGGIAKSTVYSILNRERPTTQRDVARKIAKATNRTLHIEGDKVFFEKAEPGELIGELSALDSELLKRLQNLLANYSDEEKKILLDYGLTESVSNALDLILSIRNRTVEEVSGVISTISPQTPNKKTPLVNEAAIDISTIDQRFRRIWDRAGIKKSDKIASTRDLLRNTGLPKLIYTAYNLEINILNPAGDAEIRWDYQGVNVGDELILGELKSIWFENNQIEDIDLRTTADSKANLNLEMIRDYENFKEFFVRFPEALQFQDAIRFAYQYSPQRMFTQNHYWDYQVLNFTLNSKITIRHNKQKKFKSCTIRKQTDRGLISEPNANLKINATDTEVEITWMKYLPEHGRKYRIYWDFEE